MKVKTKLRLGFGFLFVVVLFFGATALFYIRDISESSKVILKNNYETLSFARQMRTILDRDDLPLETDGVKQFDEQLQKQEHNITEPGEKELTRQLRQAFEQLKNPSASAAVQLLASKDVRKYLGEVEELNMRAIVRKNDNAQKSVSRAALFLGLVGSFTFLVLFSFSVNFPGFIANPLRALLEGIREIGEKNYNKRLHFEHNDEFAEVANAFNQMAAKLNEWENSNLATVISEKRRIETIIEQMQDAIIGINEKQEVLFMNDAARKTLNINDKITGQNTSALVKSNDLLKSILKDDATLKPFKIVLNGRESFFQLQTSNIVVPNLDHNETALRIANRSAGKVYILRNITEFKERDEAKTNFIATISHELKTPISSIKMSLKLLNDQRIGQINNEQQQLINHIKDDNDRLLKITSELLELSQVETGNIQLNFVPVDPMQIVDYAVSSIKFQAEQKQVKLEIKKDANLPQVQVDVEKTAWVLVNFLSNALRYSAERSSIVIKVTHVDGHVEFSVTDFGKGIDEAYQKRLFDRYFQVPTDGQNKSGSGLGLAISKDFINVQGGTIGVESAVGEGSKFFFSLPVAG